MTAQTITLKHLAREFDLDPFKLRRILRKKFGNNPSRRWRWQENDADLISKREFLKKELKSSGQNGAPPLQEDPQPTSSESTMTNGSSSGTPAPRGQPKKRSTSSSGKKRSAGLTTKQS